MGCWSSKERAPETDITSGKPEKTDQSQSRSRPRQRVQQNGVHVVVQPQLLPVPPQASQPMQTPSRPLQQPEPMFSTPFVDIKQTYTFGRELGRSQYGITYICTENSTGHTYACKSILKRKLMKKEDRDDVRREVRVMQHLSGQPNIVEMRGVYEDRQSVHLVMELCSGGELFDRIIEKGYYSEKAAASVIRSIVNVVRSCHFMGVIHRDLKPENFLFAGQDEEPMLKATDFGLSVFIEQGKVYRDIVGSAYYVAPEVLQRNYGKEIDIWSAGVILYVLLCGEPPFWSERKPGIFDAILKGEIDFESHPWPTVSHSAKDLVRKMLTQDPKKRFTAEQVLEHSWLREGGDASEKAMDIAVLSRLKRFRAMNKLKRVALEIIAQHLSEAEIQGLKAVFANTDTDKDGKITYQELKTGLATLGSKISETEAKQLMAAADVDGNGVIDYAEFVSAMMNVNRLEREDNFCNAFPHFDKGNSGY